ncbi:hypothetical protein H0Z60_10215 [Ectothiorhodospiraceae bacterium WFHF3C12]|nr:hypothetical protein [Ectothiorhodospiraceae bacterium WFHF3C12]
MNGKDLAVGGAKVSAAMALAVVISFGLQAWGLEVPTGITEAFAVLIGYVARQVRRAGGVARGSAMSLVLLLVATPALAVEITWDPPTTRDDGVAMDPATEVDHYDLYCGLEQGGPYDAVAYQIPGLTETGQHAVERQDLLPEYGTYHCVMTATDTDGLESGHSQPVQMRWDPAPPNAPTSVLVIE